MTKKWVYLFDEVEQIEAYVGGSWDSVRGLLGGKGANLADMARIGVPVPPGFTVTTEACNAYLQAGGISFPPGMWEQELEALKAIEQRTGKVFGSRENPLLVSCRSGAKFSMPGMMDTILNIGLNDETALGMVALTGDERFVYDSYRRLIQMFGSVVVGIPDEAFEEVITRTRRAEGVTIDSQVSAKGWKEAVCEFKKVYKLRTGGIEFPEDPMVQLRLATESVFMSWNGKRAVDYRNAANIAHDLGTAVSIVSMVFGNMGDDSATGVAMTRNGSTGENRIEGDYLTNAQGEDVVAGIRMTKDIGELAKEMPETYAEFEEVARKLEKHYREMQDMEFTIEKGKLWMLQTRDGKRTARAAVRIAADMADEGLISKEEAVLRVSPEQVDFFLHPQFSPQATRAARENGKLLAVGLNVSPGAACGIVALDADVAEAWSKEGRDVIMVRPETKPDDVHGMLAAKGILTSRGGRTSHAALVARQFGKPAVVGIADMLIDMTRRLVNVKDETINEGDWISVDGSTGEVYLGKIETVIPDIKDKWLIKLLSWADEFRKLGVRANADYPVDAQRARDYGAEGIGLCRSEHMFFEAERLPFVQRMIMTDLPLERREALEAVLPFQRKDFIGLFRVMDGLPVIIRLLDPPLHEFLPSHSELQRELTDIKIRLQHAESLDKIDVLLEQFQIKDQIRRRVEKLLEANPMLGMRGVRLSIVVPEIAVMQARAIFEAACQVYKEGLEVHPEIMIPLTSHVNELKMQRKLIDNEARAVMREQGVDISYKFGTMIELPRAALTADQLAEYSDFFSFGTNDLTQTTYGISRDDAEAGFLIDYMEKGILPDNPFATIDRDGVGELIRIGVEKGRTVKPGLECGICGEHGGEPASIALCHKIGLSYVSCSPFRVPIARLAAAHAALLEGKSK